MPLYLPASGGNDAVVVPAIQSDSQGWGLPGVMFTIASSTGSGESFVGFRVEAPITLTAASIYVTTGPASDSTNRVGIFLNDETDGLPGLVQYNFDTFVVAASATGLHSVAGSHTLQPGNYWVAHKQTESQTLRRHRIAVNGFGTTTYVSSAYGAATTSTAYTDGPTISGGHYYGSDVAEVAAYCLLRWSAA